MDENYLIYRKYLAKNISNGVFYKIGKGFLNSYLSIMGNFHVLPDYLIIGAGRAGTTSLYEGINTHQCVSRCSISAPQFFDSKFRVESQYKRNLGW